MRRTWFAGLALAAGLLAGPASAEEPQGEAGLRLAAARTARDGGDTGRAEVEYLRALALAPTSAEIVGELMALGEDPDRRMLWAYHAAAAGCDERGKFARPRTWPSVDKADLQTIERVVKARARVVKAAVLGLGKVRGAAQDPARWYLEGLAQVAAEGSPALAALHATGTAKATGRVAAEPDKVVKALESLMNGALGAGKPGVALEAARVLLGLHQQKGQKDAKKQAPGGSGSRKVREVIERIRRDLRGKETKVWTVDELRAIPLAERPAWNARHASWTAPGVATSPKGLYRVETVCGIETLLVVANEVEVHHGRIARYHGADPFQNRPGLVRVCPDYADMEGEGQPWWWAGGWQSGDTTVVQASYTDNARLGGVLTHELTHRFDGMLLPGIPTWLTEGRAVYTESCSLNPGAPELDERAYQSHRLWEAASKEYASATGLAKLLEGEVDDYRHNYDAGYALWLFLVRFRGFEEEQRKADPLFAAQVPGYLKSFKTHRALDPVKRFEQFFTDGQKGRPSTLRACAALLSRFWWEGSQGGEEPAWRKSWTEDDQAAHKSFPWSKRTFIYDRRTSTRTRNRHDYPDHGQYHAYLAGQLFEREGRKTDALAAYGWALAVDDLDAGQLGHVTAFFRENGATFSAWAIEHRLARARPGEVTAPAGPAAGPLGSAWKAGKALATLLAESEVAARTAKRERFADALRAEHDRMAGWLGAPLLGPRNPAAVATVSTGERRPPDCSPFVSTLLGGLVEERWAPLDSEVKGLWNSAHPGELELGRAKQAGAATGTIRDAHIRNVFVRGNDRHAGTYTVKTRVRFRSAFCDARIVLGHTHRDRGLMVRFSGGDWSYAVGDRKEGYPLRFVRIGIQDFRSFDADLSALFVSVPFDSPRSYFDVTVHVAGPLVRVLVNGKEAVTHRRTTGVPIEGRVGFGLHRGIVAFEDPSVRHHRTLGPDATCRCETFDEPLSLTGANRFPWGTATGRRVVGIPANPAGTLLLLYTARCPNEARISVIVKEEIETYRRRLRKADLPVAIHVLVPKPEEGEVVSATSRWPKAEKLELPAGHVHAYPECDGLQELLMSRVDAWAAEEKRRNSSISFATAKKRAAEILLSTPTWVILDDHNVIRACSPEHSPVYIMSLAHRLAGW